MPVESSPRFLALHALRLKGFADAGKVAATAGLAPRDADDALAALVADGLVVHRSGHLAGYVLTPTGRVAHAEEVAAELERAGCRAALEGCYERFLEINRELLEVCTAWQMRERDGTLVPNDHTDPAYDDAVVRRLVGVHDRVRPICADLREQLARFAPYGERLRFAVERVVAGEHEWFTKPVVDSYHTVWFELHEDLLVTLGIERAEETQEAVS